MQTSSNDSAHAPILRLPTSEAVLVGINTPLGGASITGPETDNVVVIITAQIGTLYAGTFPGAVVSGGGTRSLWVAGSPTQVNAKLATLIYAATDPGADTLSFTLIDASGSSAGPTAVPLQTLPLIAATSSPAPEVTISGGTLTLDTRQVDGLTLNIHDAQTGAGAATLVLVDSTFGTATTLDVASSDPTAPPPRIAIARTVKLEGQTDFNAGPTLVTFAQNAVLTNTGRIAFNDSTAQLSGAGTLKNDGMVEISTARRGSAPAIGVAVTGTGMISLAAGSQVSLGGPVSSSETIRFEDNSGILTLGAPQTMQATIAGFIPGDQILLGEAQIDAADYTQTGTSGTLTLYDGAELTASLHFSGTHQLSDFILSVKTDSASDGGAITTLSVRASAGIATGDASRVADVYRFFDSATGTQLLTQDTGERDALIAAHRELDYEGVAMRALGSPAGSPAATAVYRFFDTADGTHFLTASVAERDALLASRPDLRLEPTSTFWEDAAQQPGDVPVYRFFDTSTGTHFFTSSAAERASILTTRPDLTAEGVAFYAPGQ